MKHIEEFYNESRVKTKTRLNILNAATRFVIENGVTALTVQNVAAYADLTPRNVYRYYENRNFLLMDTFYLAMCNYDLKEKTDIPPEANGREQLQMVIEHYCLLINQAIDFSEEYGLTTNEVLRILFEFDYFLLCLPQDDPALERYRSMYVTSMNVHMNEQFTKAMLLGIKDGTLHLREDEIPFYIGFITQAMRGISTQVLLKQNERSTVSVALVEKMAEMIVRYLSGAR